MTRDDSITAALDELGRRLRRARRAGTVEERKAALGYYGPCPLCLAIISLDQDCKSCPGRQIDEVRPCRDGDRARQAGDLDAYARALRETRRRWRARKKKSENGMDERGGGG